MAFAENLQTIRRHANLSQENLAEQLHIARQAISKWESGQSTPDVETCLQLCKLLDVSPNQLLLGEEDFTVSKKLPQEIPVKGPAFGMTTVFLMLILLCGTILLIFNLNSRAFEPKVHTMSILMICISIAIFGIIAITHHRKRKCL